MKTAFLENNPDYPGSDVTPSSRTYNNHTNGTNNTSLAASDDARLAGHDDHNDDITDLVIDEDVNKEQQRLQRPGGGDDVMRPYITIEPEMSGAGGADSPSVTSAAAFESQLRASFSAAAVAASSSAQISLINRNIFTTEALKNAMFGNSHAAGAAGDKATKAAMKNSLQQQTTGGVGTPRARCAPVREAVDPAKYITVQEEGGVKYACSKCGNIYKWRKSLNKHWKEKHDGEIPEPRVGGAVAMPRLRGSPYTNTSPRQQRMTSSNASSNNAQYSASLAMNQHPYRASMIGQAYSHHNMPSNPYDVARSAASMKLPSTPTSRGTYRAGSSVKREHDTSMLENIRQQQKLVERFLPSSAFSKATPRSPPRAHASKPSPSPGFMARSGADSAMDLTHELSSAEHLLSSAEQEGVLDLSMKTARSAAAAVVAAPAVFNQDEPIDFSVKADSNSSEDTLVDSKAMFSGSSLWVKPKRETSKMAAAVVDTKPRQCNMCTYMTRDERDLEAHQRLHLQQTNTCAQCSEHFQHIDDLNQHFVLRHMQVLARGLVGGCEQTISEPRSGDQLYRYLTEGASKNITSCVVCGGMFQFKWALASHFDKQHASLPNPYQQLPMSPDCGSPVATPSTPVHEDMMTGMYGCTQCSYSAETASELTRHQLRHSLSKQHVCKVCGYTAKTGVELVEHYEMDHPGLQPTDVKTTTGKNVRTLNALNQYLTIESI